MQILDRKKCWNQNITSRRIFILDRNSKYIPLTFKENTRKNGCQQLKYFVLILKVYGQHILLLKSTKLFSASMSGFALGWQTKVIRK